jgi:hypothetical protein
MRYDATAANAIEATVPVKRFGKTTALDGRFTLRFLASRF